MIGKRFIEKMCISIYLTIDLICVPLDDHSNRQTNQIYIRQSCHEIIEINAKCSSLISTN